MSVRQDHPNHSERLTRRRLLEGAGMVASALGTTASAEPLMGPRAVGKLRIGVVGGGFGAQFFWREHPDCEVAAVADLRLDRRKRLSDRYQCTNVYEEFHPMLKDAKVDAVAIWSGAPDHTKHCVDVLNAGKHVICAVPAAMTLEECHTLVETVKKTGLTYMQAETGCFHAPTLSAREMRLRGDFGTIYFTQGEYLHDVSDSHPGGARSGLPVDVQGKRTWRYGFPPAKYPTHAVGPVVFVTGERLTSVACLGYRPPQDPYPDNAYQNPFENVTFLSKTTGGNASRIAIHHCFGGNGDIAERAEYWGTKMVFMEPRFGQPALVSQVNGPLKPWSVNDHTSELPENLRSYIKGGHGGSEVFITNEFVNAMRQGRRPLTDVYEGVAYCSPGICAHESALKGGDWVKVPDFGWHS